MPRFEPRLTRPPQDEATHLAEWTSDSLFVKRQPEFIRTQLYRAIGENPVHHDDAVFDSVAAWRNVFRTPGFQEKLNAHRASVVARPHLFAADAVPDLCTA
jgi:hypothetical protein